MEHVGIDLGGRKSRVCVRAADGSILEEKTVLTVALGEYMRRRPPSRVILETCAEAFAVADDIGRDGTHELRVVPATLAPALGVGARRTKNDDRDARALSLASTRVDLGSVTIKSRLARERRSLGTTRAALVRARTLLINNVKGWMRQGLVHVRGGAAASFPSRLRAYFETDPNGCPTFIESILVAIDSLTAQLQVLDKQVESAVRHDEVCRRLMTAPIGKHTALAFVAAIDSIERFESSHQLQSYLGLCPGDDSSSERKRMPGITKAGPSRLRALLVQCCWSALRTRPDDPLSLWASQVMQRRGKRIGIIAMVRKLAGVLWAIWRYDAAYDPLRAAKPRGPSSSTPVSALP